MSGTVQPGWYPAPNEPGLERQWDGATWTDERRPVAPVEQGSVAVLVLGILSILTSPVLIGIALGAVAAFLGGRNAPTSAISKAGRVFGILGIVLAIVFGVLRGLAAVITS